MKEIRLPNGTVVEFPDEMTWEDAANAAQTLVWKASLFESPEHQKEVLYDSEEDPHTRLEAARRIYEDEGMFGSRASDYMLERVPFSPTPYMEVVEYGKAQSGWDSGKPTASDLRTMAIAQKKYEDQVNKNFLGMALDIGTSIPGLTIEQLVAGAASGGVGSVAAGGTRIAAKGAVKQLGKHAAGRFALGAGSRLTKMGVARAARVRGLKKAVSTTVKAGKWISDMALQGGILANRWAVKYQEELNKGTDRSTAFMKGWAGSSIEIATERFGGTAAGKAIGKTIGKDRLGLAKRFVGKKFKEGKLNRLLKSGGWDGVFMELVEERASEIAKGLSGVEDDYGVLTDVNEGHYAKALEQISAEFVGFLGFSGAARLLSPAREGLPDDLRKATFESVGGLADQAREFDDRQALGVLRRQMGMTKQEFGEWIDELPDEKVEELKSKGYRVDLYRDGGPESDVVPGSSVGPESDVDPESPIHKPPVYGPVDKRVFRDKEMEKTVSEMLSDETARDRVARLNFTASRKDVANAAGIHRTKVDTKRLIHSARAGYDVGSPNRPGARVARKTLAEKYGVEPYKAETPKEKAMAKFLDSVGVVSRFVRDLTEGARRLKGGEWAGLWLDGVAYIGQDSDERALWRVISHEMIHATGLDRMKGLIPREKINEGWLKYEKEAGDKVDLKDVPQDERDREGIATVIGDMISTKESRDKMFADSPSAWVSLMQKITDRLVGVSGETKMQRDVLKALRREVSSAKSARIQVSQIGDRLSEATGDDLRSEYKETVDQVHKEKLTEYRDIELAMREAKKRLNMNATKAKNWEKQGKSYSSVKDIKKVGLAISKRFGTLGGRMPAPPAPGEKYDGDVYAKAVWNLVRENFTSIHRPKKADADILKIAEDRVSYPYKTAAERTLSLAESSETDKETREAFLELAQEVADKEGVSIEEAKELVAEALVEKKRSEQGVSIEEAEESLEGDDAEGGMMSPRKKQPDPSKPLIKKGLSRKERLEARIDLIRAMPGSDSLVEKLVKGDLRVPTEKEIKARRVQEPGRPKPLANPLSDDEGRQQAFVAQVEYNYGKGMVREEARQEAQEAIKNHDRGAVGLANDIIREFKEARSKSERVSIDSYKQALVTELLEELRATDYANSELKELQRFADLHDVYRTTKSEAARVTADPDRFRGVKDPALRHKMLIDTMLFDGGLSGFTVEQAHELLKEMDGKGMSLVDRNFMSSPYNLAQVMSYIATRTPTMIKDPNLIDRALKAQSMWREYYKSLGLLSGPLTATAEILTNTVYGIGYSEFVERPLKTAINKARNAMSEATEGRYKKPEDEILWGEIGEAWMALAPSLWEAIQNAKHRYMYDYSPLELQSGLDKQSTKWFSRVKPAWTAYGNTPKAKAIRGFGHIVRHGYKSLGALHDFYATVKAHMSVAALAYREAREEGLESVEDIRKRMDEIKSDRTSDLWMKALNEAEHAMFSAPVGFLAEGTKSVTRGIKEVPVVGVGVEANLPFVEFAVTAMSHAAEKTPGLGLVLSWMNEAYADSKTIKERDGGMRGRIKKKEVGVGEWDRAYSGQVVGLLVAMAAYKAVDGWLDDEEGNPMLTAGSPSDRIEREQLYAGIGPQMYRAGKDEDGEPFYLSFGRVEPFNTLLPAAMEIANGWIKGDFVPDSALAAWIGVGNKSYLQGVEQMIRVFEQVEKERTITGSQIIQEQLTTFIVNHEPNIISQPLKQFRNKLKEKRASKGLGFMDQIRQKSELLPDVEGWGHRHDIFGEVIKPNGQSTTLPANVWYALSPMKSRFMSDINPIQRKIMEWNQSVDGRILNGVKEPGEKIRVSSPAYTEKLRKAGIKYSEYAERAGKRASEKIKWKMERRWPEVWGEKQAKDVKKFFEEARREVRDELLKEKEDRDKAAKKAAEKQKLGTD